MSTESNSGGANESRPPKRLVREHVYKVSPENAVKDYLEDKGEEVRDSTVNNYHKHLKFFITWTEKVGLYSMHEISGYDFRQFKTWRKIDGNEADGDLSPRTQKDAQKVLKQFIKWCEQTDYVKDNLSKKVRIPRVTTHRDEQVLDIYSIRKMVEYAEKYHYASTKHVACLLFAETGARPVDIRALDTTHYGIENGDYILKFEDDPENGIRLKNGSSGEREIHISPHCYEVLNDYIEHNRKDVVDQYGREPLLVPRTGRIATSTLRKYVYELTRPCKIEGLCPGGLDPDSCPGVSEHAHKCKDNVSPKAIRKGVITNLLKKGFEPDYVSERCDACPRVIERYYNQMTLSEERRKRPTEFKKYIRRGVTDSNIL